MFSAPTIATNLIHEFGEGYRAIEKLSDVALGELMRRIAAALSDAYKAGQQSVSGTIK
jgi:hypothetical protein